MQWATRLVLLRICDTYKVISWRYKVNSLAVQGVSLALQGVSRQWRAIFWQYKAFLGSALSRDVLLLSARRESCPEWDSLWDPIVLIQA